MSNNDKIGDKDILQVLLTEYNSLRGELVRIFDRELQIFTIIISALGVIYGIIFSQGIYDLILFIPVLVFPLALKFKFGTYAVERIGKYLLEIESYINIMIKEQTEKHEINWMGWQHYWETPTTEDGAYNIEKEWNVLKYDVSSKWLLFVVIPTGVAILYSLIIINPEFFPFITSIIEDDLSHFNQDIHLVVAGFYTLFLVIVCTVFIFWENAYKKIIKPKFDEYKKEKSKNHNRFQKFLMI